MCTKATDLNYKLDHVLNSVHSSQFSKHTLTLFNFKIGSIFKNKHRIYYKVNFIDEKTGSAKLGNLNPQPNLANLNQSEKNP